MSGAVSAGRPCPFPAGLRTGPARTSILGLSAARDIRARGARAVGGRDRRRERTRERDHDLEGIGGGAVGEHQLASYVTVTLLPVAAIDPSAPDHAVPGVTVDREEAVPPGAA